MNEISFVILTWNSERTILDCLRSVSRKCAAEGLRYEICVVDNGSSDRTVELARGYCGSDGNKRVMLLGRNMGTTFPRNIALSMSRHGVLCILDSDAMLMGGSLGGLVSRLRDRSIGIIAPRLLLPDGSVQHSVKKFPSVTAKLLKIPRIVLKVPLRDLDFYPGFPFEGDTDVETAISACWFLRQETFLEIGPLDERIFYAPEDVDYCLRVIKSGKRILYCTDLTVLHHTQQITHRNFLGRHAVSHLYGLLYYFAKHMYIKRPRVPAADGTGCKPSNGDGMGEEAGRAAGGGSIREGTSRTGPNR